MQVTIVDSIKTEIYSFMMLGIGSEEISLTCFSSDSFLTETDKKSLKNFEVYRQKAASFEFIEKSDYAHLFESNSDSESVSTKRTLELNDSNHTTIKSEKKVYFTPSSFT